MQNVYDCVACKEKGIEHEVKTVPAGFTNHNSTWGSGIPTTKKQCSNCGTEDGPWVSASMVGGCW